MPIDYVIDANVVFAALMSGKVIYKTLFERYRCFSSDFLFFEIEKHKVSILAKTKMDSAQIETYAVAMFSRIGIFPSLLLSKEVRINAIALCERVDIDDFLYIALAMQFDKPLITRDVTLYNGLRKQKFKNIVLLQDILDNL